MELVMNNEDLTWKIFSRLTELRDIMQADEVSREWHALMQDDRAWEPLCREYEGIGAATGYEMLKALKEKTQLSWRQIFTQRARCQKPLSPVPPPPARKREDYLIGVEVYKRGKPERVLGDVQDDATVLAALRKCLTLEPLSELFDAPPRSSALPTRKARSKKKATHDDIDNLCNYFAGKLDLFERAPRHMFQLFGPSLATRKEWVLQQAMQIVDELCPAEPTLFELPALDEEEPPRPRSSAYLDYCHAQRNLLKQHKEACARQSLPVWPAGGLLTFRCCVQLQGASRAAKSMIASKAVLVNFCPRKTSTWPTSLASISG